MTDNNDQRGGPTLAIGPGYNLLSPLDKATYDLVKPMMVDTVRKAFAALLASGLISHAPPEHGGVEKVGLPTPQVLSLAFYAAIIETYTNLYRMKPVEAKQMTDHCYSTIAKYSTVADSRDLQADIAKMGTQAAIDKAIAEAFNHGIGNTEAKEARDDKIIPFPSPHTKH